MKKGNVYGPQVEIEASGPKGSESGNIYGQGLGTDFLKPKKGRVKAIKDTEWNHIRILAEGPRIRTWINGETIADIVNNEIYKDHSSGMIGFQVHGVKNFTEPQEIAWKNIRIIELRTDDEARRQRLEYRTLPASFEKLLRDPGNSASCGSNCVDR